VKTTLCDRLPLFRFIPRLHDQAGSTSWLYVSWMSQLDICSMFARSCKRGIMNRTCGHCVRDYAQSTRRRWRVSWASCASS